MHEAHAEIGSQVSEGKSYSAFVFDHAGAMARLEGDEDLLRELIQVYMDSLDDQLAALQKALDTGNAASAETTSHALKGGASNIGADHLRQHFFDMEMDGRDGKLDALAEGLQAVPKLMDELIEILSARGYIPPPGGEA
jgi:HPt (histidine-containing phosphotransfer) domain-containing protein